MKYKELFLCIFFLILLPGAACQTDEALQQYQLKLNPLIGSATKEDIIAKFGAPIEVMNLGTIEVWKYHQNFGSRAVYNPYIYSTNIVSRYDDLQITFDHNGIVVSWRAYVQR